MEIIIHCQSGCAGLTGGSVIADGVVAPCVTVKLYPDPERSLVTKPSVFTVRLSVRAFQRRKYSSRVFDGRLSQWAGYSTFFPLLPAFPRNPSVHVPRCFTSTETTRTIRDGEIRLSVCSV